MLPPQVLDALRAVDDQIAALRAAWPPSRRELARRHKKGEHFIDPGWFADYLKRHKKGEHFIDPGWFADYLKHWRRWRETRVNELRAEKKAIKRAWYETGALP